MNCSGSSIDGGSGLSAELRLLILIISQRDRCDSLHLLDANCQLSLSHWSRPLKFGRDGQASASAIVCVRCVSPGAV